MTDKEIIQGLIAHDTRVTKEFFFDKCRPLFCSIIQKVFNYKVEYDELVNELYINLMENDALKLRKFEYRSSVYQWLKVLAIRYFIKKRNELIDYNNQNTLYNMGMYDGDNERVSAKDDLERLFNEMHNRRYVYVIRKLILEDIKPEALAKEMRITTANLYNIKRRAMSALTRVALKDVGNYGK